MVFSSYLFLFYFLPATLLLYYASPRRLRHFVLTLASYVFYGWANPLFSFLLLVSTLIDYVSGLFIVLGSPRYWGRPMHTLDPDAPRTRSQKVALTVSMCANLTLLGFFKYFNFGVDSYQSLTTWLGLPALHLDSVLRVTLPLGISFYTFQSMSYAIDIYRGEATGVKNVIDFMCFETMFPQLVAGPIIRFREVAEQLRHRTHTATKFARGVAFLSLGLAKKVLLANPCGKVADIAFGAGSLHAPDAWYGVTAYAFQIYFDFSGYSDMAIGLGEQGGDIPRRAHVVGELDARRAVAAERGPQAEDHPAGLEEAHLVVGLLRARPAQGLVERPRPAEVLDPEGDQAHALFHDRSSVGRGAVASTRRRLAPGWASRR